MLLNPENHRIIKELKLSKNNSFSVTTASRYSLALYELSNEDNSLEEVEKQSISF